MSHLVYKLLPADYGRYRKHLLALDQESRYRRFAYHIQDEMINIVCDKFEKNPDKHKIFVIENDDLEVIAAGHISLEGDELELAFSVLKEYQGQGMGSSLMKRCIEWCQNRGIKGGCMVCLSSNVAIKKLAARHGILINDHGETLADIKIPDANATSVINEVLADNISKFDHLGKLQRRFARMLTYPLRF
jgi:GNAT superfamily N-acetyltransferase